jgi:hypothetical protein
MTSLDEPAFPLPEEAPGQPDQPPTPPAEEVTVQRRPAEPDAVCVAAVGLAQEAAEELARPGEVGEHLGVLAEGERLVTHYFACLVKGYRGWRWGITVARAPRSRTATVCETVLLPGDDAVLAPAWVPWSDRLAPGDLGPADVLPYREDDPLLQPGYAQTGDEEADRLAVWELGLGRARVLGPSGRDEAAARWYHGDRGPTADEAVHAAAACSTCGYFLPLAGALRQVFGVCANEWSPSDARVVSVDHGCGAHSETDVERPEPVPLPEPILDETGAEAIALPPRAPAGPDTDEPDLDEPAADEPAADEPAADEPAADEPGGVPGDLPEAVVPGDVPSAEEPGDVPAADVPGVVPAGVVLDSADGDGADGADGGSTGGSSDDPGDDEPSDGGGSPAAGGYDPQAGDDGTGVWEATVPLAAGTGGTDDAPGSDLGEGPANEGEPSPSEVTQVLGDGPVLVGDGVEPVEFTPLRIIGQLDVGPAVRPRHPAGPAPAEPAPAEPGPGEPGTGEPAHGAGPDGESSTGHRDMGGPGDEPEP